MITTNHISIYKLSDVYKVLITLTAILSSQLQQKLLRIANFYDIFKADLAHLQSAIFVQTVSFMHKLCMEMRQPTVSACPLLWTDTLGEIKKDQTEYSCLLFLNDVLCCHRVCMCKYNFSLQSW